MPASPTIATSARAPLARAPLADLDDRLQLPLATDERCLEPGAAPGATRAGHHTQRRPGVDRLLTALDLVDARVLVGDRRLGGAARDVVDQHRHRRGDRLQP